MEIVDKKTKERLEVERKIESFWKAYRGGKNTAAREVLVELGVLKGLTSDKNLRAMDIRREQDRMFARICAMLPGWNIVGLESSRFRFWRTGFHGYSNITSRIRFLENEGVPLTPPSEEIDLLLLIGKLRGLWEETEGEKNRKRKKDEEHEKEREKDAKEQKKEDKRRLVRVTAILKKNELLN